MAIHFVLRKNHFKGNNGEGKWYAHTLRKGEMDMLEIEEKISEACTVTPADVRAVMSALQKVVREGLQDGRVVNLDELGKMRLSLRSKCVDNPEEFDISKHITGVVCKYTPLGHRKGIAGRKIIRPFTHGCEALQEPVYYKDGTVFIPGGAYGKV